MKVHISTEPDTQSITRYYLKNGYITATARPSKALETISSSVLVVLLSVRERCSLNRGEALSTLTVDEEWL